MLRLSCASCDVRSLNTQHICRLGSCRYLLVQRGHFPSSGQLVCRLGQFPFYWIYCSRRPLFIKIQASGHCLDIAWLESGDRAVQCINSVILFSKSQTKRQLRHRSGVFVQSVCPCVCVKCAACGDKPRERIWAWRREGPIWANWNTRCWELVRRGTPPSCCYLQHQRNKWGESEENWRHNLHWPDDHLQDAFHFDTLQNECLSNGLAS